MKDEPVKRRVLLAILGATAAWPARRARSSRRCRGLGSSTATSWKAFRQGLKQTGYVKGRSVAIEYRWAEGQVDRLPALSADLVRRQVVGSPRPAEAQ
jgi:putative ABC transport system substrate-binding protein